MGGGVTHIFFFFEFFQKFMVGDKLTRAHICKIQVFAKKNKDCASNICKYSEPQMCKISVTQIYSFFKFLPHFMVGDKLSKDHI